MIRLIYNAKGVPVVRSSRNNYTKLTDISENITEEDVRHLAFADNFRAYNLAVKTIVTSKDVKINPTKLMHLFAEGVYRVDKGSVAMVGKASEYGSRLEIMLKTLTLVRSFAVELALYRQDRLKKQRRQRCLNHQSNPLGL